MHTSHLRFASPQHHGPSRRVFWRVALVFANSTSTTSATSPLMIVSPSGTCISYVMSAPQLIQTQYIGSIVLYLISKYIPCLVRDSTLHHDLCAHMCAAIRVVGLQEDFKDTSMPFILNVPRCSRNYQTLLPQRQMRMMWIWSTVTQIRRHLRMIWSHR